MKRCSKCKQEYPATAAFFNRCSKSKDGLGNHCKQCISAYGKAHYKANKETIDAKHKEYYEQNRRKRLNKIAQWQAKNPDKVSGYQRKHYYKNQERKIDKVKLYIKRHPDRHRNIQHGVRARKKGLISDLTLAQWEACIAFFGGACAYCGAAGIPLEQDHVIPVSKGGAYTVTNILPACRPCNCSKHTTDLPVWYSGKQYSLERWVKIQEYLTEVKRL